MGEISIEHTQKKQNTKARHQLGSPSSSASNRCKLESAGFEHVEHLIMGRSKELSKDLQNKTVARHNNGTGYRRSSQLLNAPGSTTTLAIIHKWEEHHATIELPRSGAPHKISDQAVRKFVRRAVQKPRTTWIELQKRLGGSIYGCHRENDRQRTLTLKTQLLKSPAELLRERSLVR